jgi:hypothetical protein
MFQGQRISYMSSRQEIKLFSKLVFAAVRLVMQRILWCRNWTSTVQASEMVWIMMLSSFKIKTYGGQESAYQRQANEADLNMRYNT